MASKYFFMSALVILILAMIFTQKQKEGFLNGYCYKYKTCMDCSSASGCSWCPNSKICLTSTTLKSTDTSCNQMNTISSSFRCPSAEGVEPPTLPEAIASNDIMYDFSLYKNRITDKIPPPNLYMAGEVKVSNEDLLSNMNDVRNDIANYKIEMPGIIASTVEENIKPMVNGILAKNYYIQGFEDINAKAKCTNYNSCSGCVANTGCGWNPRSNNCEQKGPNNMWQITQPSRCVLTSTTISQQMARPAGNV
jgi:positive regulator of sigma E activity